MKKKISYIIFSIGCFFLLKTTVYAEITYIGEEPNAFTNGIVKIAAILGVLMFAKEVPSLIEKIFGFKLGDSFTLNLGKKLGQSPAAAMAIGGLGGGIGGAIAGAMTGGLPGALRGLGKGLTSGAKTNKSNSSGSFFAAMRAGSKAQIDAGKTAEMLKTAGYKRGDRYADYGRQLIGKKTKAEEEKKKLEGFGDTGITAKVKDPLTGVDSERSLPGLKSITQELQNLNSQFQNVGNKLSPEAIQIINEEKTKGLDNATILQQIWNNGNLSQQDFDTAQVYLNIQNKIDQKLVEQKAVEDNIKAREKIIEQNDIKKYNK